MQEVSERLRQAKYRRHFSSIQLLRMSAKSARAVRYRPLRRILLQQELDAVRNQRKVAQASFTAHHLSWFFERAVVHVASTVTEPFNFVTTSRLPRPLPSSYPDQVRTFLELAVQHNIPTNSVVTAIASSVILDAYLPFAHAFSPEDAFSTLYGPSLLDCLEETYAPSVLPENPVQRSGPNTFFTRS
ncbi:hypothetical protein LTR48_006405 [Friedmanniomyces endolithicus]|uniref:Uncharacterized protein n=1 Tax=Rachicladosporium monterosium TaxID=1507873 RepID=A0ABR0KYK2_9PEZI|nr:hypothetical protein LTR48_006405 [Friedmanniomyces endolithicus]KAK5140723.1 hypothetical protein LTR32_006549 [Rachicladosporium monterosium]